MNIPVFLSADNNYAPYLCVVIKSVCENTKSSLNFFILDGGIDDSSKEMVENVCSQYNNTSVEFINPDSINIFRDCRVKAYMSKSAFFRLLIPNLKPQFDKVLYLDVDLFVNLDIEELFNQNLGDYIIGAVYEECNEKYHSYCTKKSLGIDMKHKYFNSGVLLINCKKWRENNITQKLKDTYDKIKDRMPYHDQDLLNYYFSTNNYCMLDKRFNYIIQNYYVEDSNTENPNIICHYDGPMKPWQFSSDLKTDVLCYKDIWWKYAKQTDCYNIIKDKCIYIDSVSLRIVIATKAHLMMTRHKLEQIFKEKEKQV